MNDDPREYDDVERLLADSFDRQARSSVSDRSTPPRPRFLDAPAASRRHRTTRLLAPIAAAAAVVAVVVGIAVVQRNPSPSTGGTAANPPAPLLTTAPALTRTPASDAVGPHAAVHVSLLNADHSVVGVGMPVIAYFTRPISDASAFARATSLTVNGKPATGAWYFERSADPGHPIEGHFRMSDFWPADAKIHLDLPVSGLPAGKNLAFDDSLTLDFSTGPAQIVTVDDADHSLVLSRNGRAIEKAPVSLGAQMTPTRRGVKVIMEKGKDISMKGPGYYDPHVQWTQRLTYDGEYLHAAPWNSYNIEHGIDTSNGCTNLTDSDAKRLYGTLRVGDVVEYPNASGPKMSLADGYGDWNVSWPTWLTGGAVPTR
jgi:lipoprotein-anchoring transpeptidase ErfK/SrfK